MQVGTAHSPPAVQVEVLRVKGGSYSTEKRRKAPALGICYPVVASTAPLPPRRSFSRSVPSCSSYAPTASAVALPCAVGAMQGVEHKLSLTRIEVIAAAVWCSTSTLSFVCDSLRKKITSRIAKDEKMMLLCAQRGLNLHDCRPYRSPTAPRVSIRGPC
jgi:hypothetical protein